MKIGIVSGIGPLAGADILSKLFAYAADQYGAHEDHEYPDVVLLNHGINGVDNIAHLTDNFKKGVVDMIEQLDDWDCSIIGIACNTAHAYISDAHVKPTTTLINLLDVTARTATPHTVTYGLLTSRGTKEQQLYSDYLQKYNVNFVTTNENQQKLLDMAIDNVMEHKALEAGKYLQQVLNQMNSKGIHHFIAGCTELPIALQGIKTSDSILDSNYILAKKLADAYYDGVQ